MNVAILEKARKHTSGPSSTTACRAATSGQEASVDGEGLTGNE